MNWLHAVWTRYRALVSREALDRELDEEIRFHLEMQVEENLRRGRSPEQARREAAGVAPRRFAGVDPSARKSASAPTSDSSQLSWGVVPRAIAIASASRFQLATSSPRRSRPAVVSR